MSTSTSPEPPALRPLGPEDVEGCADLVASSALMQRYGYAAERARADLALALDNQAMQLVGAFVDERLVGFTWHIARGAFARSGYLKLILVAPELAGRGIGKALIADLEARHLEPAGVVLLCTADNAPAQRFYERLGYARVGEIPGYVGPGLDETIFYKPPRHGRGAEGE